MPQSTQASFTLTQSCYKHRRIMASEQEMADMERMSSDWRPDAPVITDYRLLTLILISLLGTFSRATAVDECAGH